jgi:hypothetical protein
MSPTWSDRALETVGADADLGFPGLMAMLFWAQAAATRETQRTMNPNRNFAADVFGLAADWRPVAWGIAFVAPVLSYVWPAQRRGPSVQTVSAGKADDFKDWHKMVAISGQPVIVFRTPQGFRAYSAICTHLGCIVGNGTRNATRSSAPATPACSISADAWFPGRPRVRCRRLGVAVVNGEVLVKSA